MLLRSSSTPVLGSLVSSINDGGPNVINHHESSSCSPGLFKHQPGFSKFPSYHSSPSMSPDPSLGGFRRSRSDGNLEALAAYDCGGGNSSKSADEEAHISPLPPRFPVGKPARCFMLETIPSFSFYNSRYHYEEDEEEEEDSEDVEDEEEPYDEGISAGLGLSEQMGKMGLSDGKVNVMEVGYYRDEMHIARGLGIELLPTYPGGGGGDGGGGSGRGGIGGGGGGYTPAGGDGGDMRGTEDYYKRMVEDNPGNPLFLRNYAQFLHQTKKDMKGAEEYYSRAILADPNDGEILSQYAKLIWGLHRDEDRASTYFERSVQASPQDSHVHAAYASFLWEAEDDEDECGVAQEMDAIAAPQRFHQGSMASAGA
ncbi:unnamed protein product [Linum trigynum]|uniref:TmcB/TmcC TPR repeats domain-containing protein n=1 Tax=Linum trigynum TaxID=586398 RepID=A0AAV2EC69_9ROSI